METLVNENPRVGINSLCEYVVSASPLRRQAIIKQAKEPPLYIARNYNQAEEFLAHFLSIKEDSLYLKDFIKSLRKGPFKNDTERKNSNLSADALSGYLPHVGLLEDYLQDYVLRAAVFDQSNKLIIEKVQISVRPEILIMDKTGRQQLGFVKFYFSKSKILNPQAGEINACLGKYFFQQERDLRLKNKVCLVLDVFRGEIFQAPTAEIKRLGDIKASCREISDRWSLI